MTKAYVICKGKRQSKQEGHGWEVVGIESDEKALITSCMYEMKNSGIQVAISPCMMTAHE